MTAKKKLTHLTAAQRATAAFGNGLSGSWIGYAGTGWQDMEVVVDAEKRVPLRARFGEWEQVYGEFREVKPGQFAPMSVRTSGSFSLDMRFVWAGDCLWIARETVTSWPGQTATATARLTNLTVNGQVVPGIPVLSGTEIKQAQEALAAARAAREEERRKAREGAR